MILLQSYFAVFPFARPYRRRKGRADCCFDHFDITPFSTLEQTHCAHALRLSVNDYPFIVRPTIFTEVMY